MRFHVCIGFRNFFKRFRVLLAKQKKQTKKTITYYRFPGRLYCDRDIFVRSGITV